MSRPLGLASVLLLCIASPILAQGSMAGMTNMNSSADTAQLNRIKTALEKYKDPIAAVRDGYFSTLACVEFPTGEQSGTMAYRPGGMGVHFLNPGLVGPQLDTLRPQVLIYEPDHDTLKLVAAEWFMPTQVSAQRPHIFGRDLDGPMEGHAPIMPAEMHHWDLHVWLWKTNPNGEFSPTNPTVTCPRGARYTFAGGPPRMVMQ